MRPSNAGTSPGEGGKAVFDDSRLRRRASRFLGRRDLGGRYERRGKGNAVPLPGFSATSRPLEISGGGGTIIRADQQKPILRRPRHTTKTALPGPRCQLKRENRRISRGRVHLYGLGGGVVKPEVSPEKKKNGWAKPNGKKEGSSSPPFKKRENWNWSHSLAPLKLGSSGRHVRGTLCSKDEGKALNKDPQRRPKREGK